MSGEDLPALEEEDVELCRIRFHGTVHNEVTAVVASVAGSWLEDRIAELEDELGIDAATLEAMEALDEACDEDDTDEDEDEDEDEDDGWDREQLAELREEYEERRGALEERVWGRYVLHVVDEVGLHDGEPFDIVNVDQPLSLGELISYLDSCDWWGTGSGLVWGAWHTYNEGRQPGDEDFVPLEQAADFIIVESDLYPELGAFYREQLRP